MIKFGLMEERELSIGAAKKLGHFSTFCHIFMLSELFAFARRARRYADDLSKIWSAVCDRYLLTQAPVLSVGTFLCLLNP